MADTRRQSHRKETDHRYYDAYRNFGAYYSYTSNAYAVDVAPPEEYPDEYAEQVFVTAPQKVIRPARGAKPARRVRYRMRIDPRIKISKEIVFLILFIFAGMIGVVYSQSLAQGAFGSIKTLGAELAEVKNHNAVLQVELYENFNKDEIEHIAATRLNMTKRKPHQEIRVSVPKASYVVQNKPKATQPRLNLLGRILEILNGDW